MGTVTEFGKILRKMRIDCSEVLGVMAKRLNVSPAYLSSIENDGRVIPEGFVAKIAAEYHLDDAQVRELEEAEAKVRGSVDVRFSDQKTEANYVETAVMFARDFSRLSAEQVKELNNLLRGFESSEVYVNGKKSI